MSLRLFAIQYLNGFCKGGGDNLKLYRNATVELQDIYFSVKTQRKLMTYSKKIQSLYVNGDVL